ncbi:hypothetical protein A4R35_00750 [Thermogemmatispora tikiterensis]|uniref:Uncharacterized protein n=1 Tax=Thermogemmatispora tikiterensis TaxID=1825093 RepID=A0A328VE57_9CHLR|nr:hypothetical protein A4R35_00750 [Thermogemmatispora tikiterensis]
MQRPGSDGNTTGASPTLEAVVAALAATLQLFTTGASFERRGRTGETAGAAHEGQPSARDQQPKPDRRIGERDGHHTRWDAERACSGGRAALAEDSLPWLDLLKEQRLHWSQQRDQPGRTRPERRGCRGSESDRTHPLRAAHLGSVIAEQRPPRRSQVSCHLPSPRARTGPGTLQGGEGRRRMAPPDGRTSVSSVLATGPRGNGSVMPAVSPGSWEEHQGNRTGTEEETSWNKPVVLAQPPGASSMAAWAHQAGERASALSHAAGQR